MKNSWCCVMALALTASIAAAQEPQNAAQGGPTQLIITYRSPPPRRTAFRQYMAELGMQRFERWKQDGLLQQYRFLFNWYVDVDTWDAMAVLTFADYAHLARWKEIEKTNPGGLARDALEMSWPLNTYSVDMLAHGPDDQPPSTAQSIYFVTPYDVTGDSRDFVNSYLIPQAKGWAREGILASYHVYANRYAGGKRWQVLLVAEYKDLDAFARRDEVNAKVRAQLRSDPAWRAASEKHKSSTEREPVIADAMLPR